MSEWKTVEPFDTNEETGGARLPFTFNGLVSTPLSIDPAEFRGLATPAITAQLTELLSGISPNVSFFPDELELAAEEIGKANGGG